MSDDLQNNNGREYKHWGHAVFLIFVLKRSLSLLVLALLIAGLISLSSWSLIPSDYLGEANMALLFLSGLFGLLLLIFILLAWLECAHYKIFVGADNIKINKGVISEEEIGVPFKRIKEANVERSLGDQLLGFSKVVLLVASEDEDKESKIVLAWLKKSVAKEIQETVLNKSEVEEVSMAPNEAAQ